MYIQPTYQATYMSFVHNGFVYKKKLSADTPFFFF